MVNIEAMPTNEKSAYLGKGIADFETETFIIDGINTTENIENSNNNFNKKPIISNFEAEKLLENFQCCFLKQGSKAPQGDSWQKNPRKISEWTPTTGLGIICGQIPNCDYSIHALDFDTYTPAMAEAMREKILARLGGIPGETLIRVGLPPKFLIPFKIKTELRKQTTKVFWTDPTDDKSQKNQLEILGKGNQFVAYHIHPETLKPYLWADETNSTANLFDVSLEDLIELEQGDINQIKAEFEKAAAELNIEESEKDKTAAAAPVKSYNHKSIFSGLGGIREKIVAYHDLHDVLTRNGYTHKGRNNYLYAGSSTGNPGVNILPNNGTEPERIYSHHSGDPLADGYSHDVASVLCILEYNGDFSTMIKSLAPVVDPEGQRQRRAEFRDKGKEKPKADSQTKKQPLSDTALRMEEKINFILYKELEISADDAETRGKLAVDAEKIDKMLFSSFWSGNKNKIFILSPSGELNIQPSQEAYKFLIRACGNPIDKKALTAAVEAYFKGKETDETKFKPAEKKEFLAKCLNLPKNEIIDFLKENQREALEWRVDMFADQPRMEKLDDKVRIVLTHKPFSGGKYDKKIIDDFKKHFTRLDVFIDFLANARFASDRKQAYLWIHAESDWGKGFLLSILRGLNISVEMSTRELEGIFEGKPSGKSPGDFKRAFALVFNEFKNVKSEIKELESRLQLSPKHQLQSVVDIYAKIFLSAENVASLVTSHGVEDQFANRMSIFKENGNLTTRLLFIEVGSSKYLDNVTNYFIERINLAVAELRSLGKAGSEKAAETFLNDFIGSYGLGTIHKRLSQSLPDLAQEFVSWCINKAGTKDFYNGFHYLKKPGKHYEEFLTENYPFSEIKALMHKKGEIERLCSEDGKGSTSYRINGVPTTAIKLKKYK